MSATAQTDDFLIVEDIDISDDTELRRVVAETEALIGNRGRGLRVSILSADQWQSALSVYLPASRAGADRFVHVLAHRSEPQHLLFSPSAAAGVNERSHVTTAEVVYTVLRNIPSPLASRDLRRGVDELMARQAAERLDLPFFTRHYPRESSFVEGLVSVMVCDYGHSDLSWLRLLRQNPDQFFLALRKSSFCVRWAKRLSEDEGYAEMLRNSDNRRVFLVDHISDESFKTNDIFAELTVEAAQEFCSDKKASKKASKTKTSRGAK